jgi:hypothetical protein
MPLDPVDLYSLVSVLPQHPEGHIGDLFTSVTAQELHVSLQRDLSAPKSLEDGQRPTCRSTERLPDFSLCLPAPKSL